MVHVQVETATRRSRGNERLVLTLSAPSGTKLADGTAVGTITNDDTAPLPTISISDASVIEGNPGGGGVGGGGANRHRAGSAPRATRSSIRPATRCRSPA